MTIQLKVTEHVLATLRALEENAIADHVALDAAGLPGPAEAMAQRADAWRQLAGVVDLFDDPHFVAAYVEMTDAKAERSAVAERPVDPRAAALADARRMLDFLEANPALPIGPYSLQISVHPKGTDADRMDAVDRAAEILGGEAGNDGPAGYHYQVSKKLGSVSYTVTAISSDPAVKVLAREAIAAYADEPDAVRVELVPAAALDEDQPAAPARGHGQDDGELMDWERELLATSTPEQPEQEAARAAENAFLEKSFAAIAGDADEDFEFYPTSAEDYALTTNPPTTEEAP